MGSTDRAARAGRKYNVVHIRGPITYNGLHTMRLGNKVPGFQVLLLFFISTDASDQTFRADHDSLTSTGPQDPEMYDTNNIFKPQVFLDTTQLNLISKLAMNVNLGLQCQVPSQVPLSICSIPNKTELKHMRCSCLHILYLCAHFVFVRTFCICVHILYLCAHFVFVCTFCICLHILYLSAHFVNRKTCTFSCALE